MTWMKNIYKKSHAQGTTLQQCKLKNKIYSLIVTLDLYFVKYSLHQHIQSGVIFKGGGQYQWQLD